MMLEILDLLRRPWPWYVAGPLLGLAVPFLLLFGNKLFGISPSLRHLCAAIAPGRAAFFRYDWRGAGAWNLALVSGILVGGAIAAIWLAWPEAVAISPATQAQLVELGVRDFDGLVPGDVFAWEAIRTWRGAVILGGGGLLVGFGVGWAGGCTSGHAISGLADLQLPSLIAAAAFFAGGLVVTHLILPLLF
jgi:uncharacterized protein